jgi:hypothetical protein
VYETMNGPNEFTVLGNLKDWDRTERLGAITAPTLITARRYDEITPVCAETLHQGIPRSQMAIFEQSAHLAHIEGPERYLRLVDFLAKVEALLNETGKSMGNHVTTRRSRIDAALAAQMELLSGGVSGASTYRVHGLSESCVLKLIEADSAAYVRARGYREIHFYNELAARLPVHTPRVLASIIEESGYCALLLAAYEPVKPANALRADDFTEIATQLARFHAVYWNHTAQLANLSWLTTPTTPDLTNDTRHARETWRAGTAVAVSGNLD